MKDEALKLALEALQFSGNIWHMDCKKDEAMTAIKEALAQPAQEPLAWIEKDIQCDDFDPDSVTCEKPARAADGWEWIPLYTTPPQRPWVSLTDDQIKEIVGPWGDTPIKGYTRKLIDQIEAKLRENNNG